MKRLLPIFNRVVLFIVFVCIIDTGFSQYSGTYFISDTSFFKSFGQAVDSVESQGVSGMLTFNVMPGTYEERLNIEHVLTTDASKQVTFKSFYGDSSQVILTDSCHIDSNYVIRLGEGCNYWNFEGITIKSRGDLYGHCAFIDHYPQHIRFSNCVFSGIYSSPASNYGHRILVYSTDAYIDYLTFENNLFEYGSTALYLHGNNNGTGYIEEILIQNNRFLENGYQGILIHNGVSPVITNNYIQCYDDAIAISVAYVSGTITNNTIFAEDVGISFNTSGYFSPNALIANNFIHLGLNGNRGISLGGGNGAIDIFHNTIVTTEEYFQNYGIYFGSNSINARYRVKNNIISCVNGGYPLYIYSLSEIDQIDYNAYYTPGNFFAYVGGQGRIFNLNDFTDSTGFDEHSYMAYPYFISDINLHAKTSWYNNRGTVLAEVSTDIDGDLRDPTHPDIGADEYTPGTLEMFSGSYTIGEGGYFESLDQAVDSLKLKGIASNTSLEFLDGEYLVKTKIPCVSGATDGSILTITSQSSDAESVILKHDNVNQDTNYILYLDGADFLTIRDLSFDASINTMFGVNLWFRGGSEKLELSDNIFKGTSNANNLGRLTLLYSTENFYRDLTLSHNVFDSCAHAIYFQFSKNEWHNPEGIIIDSNSFTHVGYSGIYLQRSKSSQVSYNTISAGARGIQLISNEGYHNIIGNRISLDYGRGIYIGSTLSTSENRGVIANNFISVAGVGESQGISLITTDYQDIFFNSINISGTSTSDGRAFYSNSSDHLTLYNNIFSNSGGGYSYFTTTSIIDSSDYNDLYVTGTNLANILGATYTDLSAMQSGESIDLNSVSTDPVFTSATDLHLADDTLAYLGYPLNEILIDIDGENRSLTDPSIGADEYTPFINTPPYVDKAIPDTTVLVNTEMFNMALLDTVFIDNDWHDILIYNSISNNINVTPTIEEDTLRIHIIIDFIGQAIIVVTARDLYMDEVSDTFYVNVVGYENTPPVAVDDEGIRDDYVVTNVLRNDYDIDSDMLTIDWVGDAHYGSTGIEGDSTVYYVLENEIAASDSFRYAITDGNGGRDTAWVVLLYIVQQDGFEITNIDLDSVSHGSVAWGDYDADGDLDLLLTGWLGTEFNYTSKIYRNDAGNLVETDIEIQGVSSGSDKACAWTDFNNDGQLDFIITGAKNGDPTSYVTELYEQDDGTFIANKYNFVQLTSSSVDWGDYDHDGDYDLLISGKASDNDYSLVFRNRINSENNFEHINYGFDEIWNTVANWGDFDNDGDLDVLSSGFGTSTSQYRNDSIYIQSVTSVLNSVEGHSADVGDYDMDGDLDIVMISTNSDTAYSCVYRCEEHTSDDIWAYSLLAYIQDIEAGTAIWGDYDNDGDLDFLISGTKAGLETHTVLYENPEGFAFTAQSTALPNLGRSAAAWGDYDNDHDLDLVLTGWGDDGPVSIVAKNNRAISNTPPTAPTGLLEDIYQDKANLVWIPSSDANTAQAGLSYNIRMGTSSGGCDIISPLSLTNGYRQLPKIGNVGQAENYMVYGLEPNTTYYWSVQAIDNCFEGSAFSIEKAFTTLAASNTDYLNVKFIKVYPNPVKDKVNIEFNLESEAEAKIEVYNELGQLVISEVYTVISNSNQVYQFSLNDNGLYVLKIVVHHEVYTCRIIY